MYRTPPHRPAPLFSHLNGWRRIGVVLVVVWLAIAGTVLWRSPDMVASVFPELAEPVTSMHSVRAPELKEELEAAKVKQLGRPLKPWEMEWNPVREVPVQAGVQIPAVTRWLLLISVPLLAWQLVELLVWVVLWVRAGFMRQPGR